jgi:hypothetical protein
MVDVYDVRAVLLGFAARLGADAGPGAPRVQVAGPSCLSGPWCSVRVPERKQMPPPERGPAKERRRLRMAATTRAIPNRRPRPSVTLLYYSCLSALLLPCFCPTVASPINSRPTLLQAHTHGRRAPPDRLGSATPSVRAGRGVPGATPGFVAYCPTQVAEEGGELCYRAEGQVSSRTPGAGRG